MVGLMSTTRIYAYCAAIDMRKGYDGLAALVRQEMGQEPLSGALFLFTNRRRTHAKILWFDGSGMCIYAKRLEKGQFAPLWKYTADKRMSLTRSELHLFLEGSQLVGKYQVSPGDLPAQALAPRMLL